MALYKINYEFLYFITNHSLIQFLPLPLPSPLQINLIPDSFREISDIRHPYSFQSLIMRPPRTRFTVTFCFSRQPSSRTISIGRVSPILFPPSLVSFLVFLSATAFFIVVRIIWFLLNLHYAFFTHCFLLPN